MKDEIMRDLFSIETINGDKSLMIARTANQMGFEVVRQRKTGGVLLDQKTAAALAQAFTNDWEGHTFVIRLWGSY